ncbi:MAG: ACT domain-containing protein [Clostridiaceae bacterium]|nr:ACT domain-containing protein [Clostridiaceae bacterium]
MLVKQISVFLENKSGRLAEVTRTLKDHKIDIRALYIADTTEYGILRMIVDQPEKAQEILSAAGFTVSSTHVIAIAIADHPGTLDEALETLSSGAISVDYLYAFVGRASDDAIVIIRVENPQLALEKLEEAQIRVLDSREVYGT